MNSNEAYTFGIMEVCLLAGKIMLQSGAETYRVEDTMTRMAEAFGIKNSQSYVTPTGIIISLDESERTKTKLIRILERTTDLEKVTKVNSVSRRISNGELTIDEAFTLLKEIERSKRTYSIWIQVLAASIASGCFLIMFNGKWNDFIPAFITGGLGFLCSFYFHLLVSIKFFAEFLAALIVGVMAFVFVHIGIGNEIDKIIIGSVMPLVPGVLITNAVRDLMAGHLVSGLSKGAEAFLTAFAIGSGIAVIFSLF